MMKHVTKWMLPVAFTTLSLSSQAQVKKVIMEDYTGAWCGWCPEGAVLIETMAAQNPTNMIAVATHDGDPLEISEGTAVIQGIGVQGFPSGAIDRFKFSGANEVPVNRGSWQTYFNQRKATTAKASVSIANLKYVAATQKYEADIKVKFTSAPTAGTPLVVNAYILEDSIKAEGPLAQHNYSNQVQGGADPLTNWYHNHTLRMALGGAWGFTDVFPATPVVNTEYTKHVTFSLSADYVKKNLHLVAFVAYNGSAATQKEILNAEEIRITTTTTGINEFDKTASFLGFYPNPARSNDLIRIEYQLKQGTHVRLNVYNLLGQQVAQPYSSNDASGAHTIHWRPSEQGVAAGTYILRLETADGFQSMKLTLR